MITTEKKSNKIQHKLKFVKYLKLEIFSSNHNVFCDFLMDLYYINNVGKVQRSLAISGKKMGYSSSIHSKSMVDMGTFTEYLPLVSINIYDLQIIFVFLH